MDKNEFFDGDDGISPALGISVTRSFDFGDTESLRRISRSDAGKLFAAVTDVETRLLMMVMWETGGRLATILELRPEDCDLKNRALLFRERNSSARNAVPISEELAGELSALLAITTGKRVFPVEADSVVRLMNDLGSRILGRPVNPHSLIQGRAFELVARGLNPFLVARALARSNLMMLVSYFGRHGMMKGTATA